ncbi:MAG TPA: hypothetical protein VN732_00510 [Solirubrobacterales bacterium]|nr:hypothetical protein [Solirubrobacterales bacterium]
MAAARRAAAGGVAVIVLSLLAAGCGSDDSTSVTQAEFVKKAEKLCEDAQRRQGEATAKAAESFPRAEIEKVSTQEGVVLVGIGVYEDTTESLGSLQAPTGEEEAVERLLEAREEAAVRVREAPATVLFSKYPFRQANDLAAGYGVSKCQA